MFEKIKKLKQLKELQNSLAAEKIEIEKRGVKIIINGKMEVEQISLNSELSKEEQEKVLQKCINDAMKRIQVIVAQKMSQVSGFLR